jgi:precorrin-6A/cobalt-precorrin-6A reductase
LKILILGGTTEGSGVARALADDARFQPVLSLAGRTRAPALPAVAARRGGFGGVAGLAAYLRDEGVGALIDATHPFAPQMHRHAAEAAAVVGVPRVTVWRPAWVAAEGDLWTDVPTMEAAVAMLGEAPRRVFLTVGQQELAPFRAAPWHDYLVRSVEAPDPADLPPGVRCIAARGPFLEADEVQLLHDEKIQVVVTKNSGGDATVAKLLAARRLGIPVIMVARPPMPEAPVVPDVAGVLAWLHHLMLHQRTLRGV